MKSPLTIAVIAVAFGLTVAAIAIFVMKPHDKAIVTPGSFGAPDTELTQAFEPPRIIVLGNSSSEARTIHLVLGGSQKDDASAYKMARNIQRNNDTIALNIIPAFDKKNVMYQGFEWALLSPKNSDAQTNYIDSIMSIGGTISQQALAVAAQNASIDVNSYDQSAQQDIIGQALDQSARALPPELPALWIDGQWLYGATLNEDNLGLKTGQNGAQNGDTSKVILTKAYAYATPPNPKVASIFLTAKNIGSKDAIIVSAQSPVAGKIELHNHFHENNAMMMRQVDNITVPVGQTVTLEPSGLHLMLYSLPAPLAVGQTFPLTLTTQSGAEISTLVKVTPIGQSLTDEVKVE